MLLTVPAWAQPPGYEFIQHRGSLCRLAPESLPWRLYSNDPAFFQVTLHCVRTWNAAGHAAGMPDLFSLVDSPSSAQLVIDWSGRNLPPDKAAAVWWNTDGTRPRIVGLTIDPDRRLPVGNLAQILLQELGHILGLDHSDRREDVMYRVMQTRRYPNLQAAELSARDLAAFRWLYVQPHYLAMLGPFEQDTPAVPEPSFTPIP